MFRRAILAAALMAGLVPAISFAQAPPPVPALPDTERRTSYSISAQTGPFSVGFALYGDSTDYADWLTVSICTSATLNPCTVLTGVTDWTLSSATGSLASIARPITDATITLTVARTGTLQIVGARRPRRTSQFTENRGVAARDLNQIVTDLVAQNRENWDLQQRQLRGQPGEIISALQPATTRAGGILCWDATGLIPQTCAAGSSGTANVVGPNVSVVGHIATFGNTLGTILTDGGLVGAGNVVGPGSSTNGAFAQFNGTTGLLLKNGPTVILPANGGTGNALTASNGGIAYSDASSIQILAGTATARQMLQSGSSVAPAWSTATWPATTTANQLLYSSATNTVAGLASAANGVLVTDGSSVPSISATLPAAVQGNITAVGTIGSGTWSGSAIAVANGGTGGTAAGGTLVDNISGFATTGYLKRTGAGTYAINNPIPLADGGTNASLTASIGGLFYSTGSAGAILAGTGTANQIPLSGSNAAPSWSTTTWPGTVTTSNILYASGSNAISGLATANNGVLITSGAGVPSIGSTLPNAVQANITTLGTVSTGIWQGTPVTGSFIGTNTVANSNLATAANLTVKSNISGGTASESDNTLSAILDSSFSSAQGTILYRSSVAWSALAAGSPGQFLTTQGAGANPNWGSGGAGTGTVTTVNCAGVAITASGTCPEPFSFENCSLAASVGSSILTVAVKDNGGNDPSATSACRIAFRSATAATGSWSLDTVTSALSITTNAVGATLGSVNSTAFKLWVVAFDNAGTVVLALINCSNSTQIFPINEGVVASTTPMSGSATSAGVFYTPNGTTLTNKAFKILGYVEYNSTGLATAGTYATAPNFIQSFGAGIRKPGEVIQTVYVSSTSAATTSSATYVTLTSGFTISITPTSAANPIRVEGSTAIAQSTGGTGRMQLSRGTTAATNLFGSVSQLSSAGGNNGAIALIGIDLPNTISSQTYAMQGRTTAGTITSPVAGDTAIMIIQEIMGALPEFIPDNDNDPRLLNMVG